MKKSGILLLSVLLCPMSLLAQKTFSLASPDGKIKSEVKVGDELTYSLTYEGRDILKTSAIGMSLDNGVVWGKSPKLSSSARQTVDSYVSSPLYRADRLKEHYNSLVLKFKGGWNVEFRAYNDGVAYRFVSDVKKPFNVKNEKVEYCFASDVTTTTPYVRSGQDGNFESQYFNSFENTYVTTPISKMNKKRLAFLPVVADAGNGVKICITEVNIENYPGMYLLASESGHMLNGHFAPYPKTVDKAVGHNNLQVIVKEREDYIAEISGPRNFPWRVAVVTSEDKNLAATNLSYLLAEPSRVSDISWIKPGKVAWDWWNDWNIDGVDFISGVNNDTYKHYIDFASANGIEYVILDEGWAVNKKYDLMQVVNDIDLKELTRYASSKNVGLILWAGFYAFERDMENVCRHYSEMGIKGFKVDFMDRDDQQITDFEYKAAAMCAKYKLILDFHGSYKPAGMNRTYPNVLNFEGVHGLEQMKWSSSSVDQMKYDVLLPFLRQVAGPMDYTQGAMRNATRSNYYPCNNEPMSQGTRCHQLALYMIFDSPLNMLCDNPSNYVREQECTDFISSVPTVWDETVIVDARMGEYIITARRKGDVWYVGGITDWNARNIEMDFSFLGDKSTAVAELYDDGANAHRVARDYKKSTFDVSKNSKLKIHMAPGGGFAMKLK